MRRFGLWKVILDAQMIIYNDLLNYSLLFGLMREGLWYTRISFAIFYYLNAYKRCACAMDKKIEIAILVIF